MVEAIAKEAILKQESETMANKKVYFQVNDIAIYNDDFLKTECVEKNSIDLIVTSPPYNVDIG